MGLRELLEKGVLRAARPHTPFQGEYPPSRALKLLAIGNLKQTNIQCTVVWHAEVLATVIIWEDKTRRILSCCLYPEQEMLLRRVTKNRSMKWVKKSHHIAAPVLNKCHWFYSNTTSTLYSTDKSTLGFSITDSTTDLATRKNASKPITKFTAVVR